MCCSMCCLACTCADKLCSVPSTIAWLDEKEETKLQMFMQKKDFNEKLTCALRLASTLCMYLGIVLILSPFTTLFSYIPFLGAVINFALYFLAFLLTLILASVTIATAYIFYRPLIAIPVLLVMAALTVYLSLSIDTAGIQTQIAEDAKKSF